MGEAERGGLTHGGCMFGTLIAVDSAAIRAVDYDGQTLAVLFHTSDTIYEHHGVPLSVFLGLMQADSMGAYYNQHIRGKYR